MFSQRLSRKIFYDQRTKLCDCRQKRILKTGSNKKMAKKLFVGGIPWATTSDDLQQLFSQHGTVASATVITDKMTGRSRGFGFVEFENDAEADAATAALNNSDYNGRTLVVKEARPLEDRPKRSFGDRGGRGGYGGGSGGNGGGYGGGRNDRY
jgi:RNA recognition motif-containing protein